MRFPVIYRGQDAGWVEVETDAHGVMCFQVESPARTEAVLRLYGLTQTAPLRIGVLEPEDGVLRLQRRITPESLRAAGVHEPPVRYYLDDGQPGCLPELPEAAAPEETGDPLLDRLIASGAVTCTKDSAGWTVRIPFAAGEAQPLNFALSACALEQDKNCMTAVLHKQKSP